MQISGTPVADLKMLQDVPANAKRGSRRTEHAPRKRKRPRHQALSSEFRDGAGSSDDPALLAEAATNVPGGHITEAPANTILAPTISVTAAAPATPSLGISRSLPQLGPTLTAPACVGGADRAGSLSVSPAKRSLRATASATGPLGPGSAEASERPPKRRRLETLSVSLPAYLSLHGRAYPLTDAVYVSLQALEQYDRARETSDVSPPSLQGNRRQAPVWLIYEA